MMGASSYITGPTILKTGASIYKNSATIYQTNSPTTIQRPVCF